MATYNKKATLIGLSVILINSIIPATSIRCLFFLTLSFPALALADSGINPAYEAEAQLLIKSATRQNGLDKNIWPYGSPEKWPDEKVIWSQDSPRRLISLDFGYPPLYGTVDVSGLTALENLNIIFSSDNEEDIHRLIADDNEALKNLMIHVENRGGLQSTLNLESLAALERLILNGYGLESLDLRPNEKLRELELSRLFNLKNLDLSASTALESLTMSMCLLESLDISRNAALKAVDLQSGRLERITIGDNPLEALEERSEGSGFSVNHCRVPLSEQAVLLAARPGKLSFGPQHNVMFFKIVFPTAEEAVVDLSSEAVLNGVATDFAILDDKLNIASKSRYHLKNGVIKFKRRGRYVAAMCNQSISGDCEAFKQIKNFNQGYIPGLYTGHIEVGDVSDQKELIPGIY